MLYINVGLHNPQGIFWGITVSLFWINPLFALGPIFLVIFENTLESLEVVLGASVIAKNSPEN